MTKSKRLRISIVRTKDPLSTDHLDDPAEEPTVCLTDSTIAEMHIEDIVLGGPLNPIH
jgi:hypothetical protein